MTAGNWKQRLLPKEVATAYQNNFQSMGRWTICTRLDENIMTFERCGDDLALEWSIVDQTDSRREGVL